jgi:uncharacterized protein (DUF305 family)
MRLQRMLTSWVLFGGLIAVPAVLAGCSNSSIDSVGSDTHTMPMGESPMTAHAMTMYLGPKDAEFDLRFIDGMILHHQGAIAMAEAVLQNSQRDEMKQLAEAVIAAQQGEIDQMRQWRQAWYPDASEDLVMYDTQMGHTMVMTPEMQTAMMMDGDLGKADDEFDLRFINAMIPHHEGALTMAEQVLENSERSELRQVAQNILATQQAEIDQMEQWRQEWYGE